MWAAGSNILETVFSDAQRQNDLEDPVDETLLELGYEPFNQNATIFLHSYPFPTMFRKAVHTFSLFVLTASILNLGGCGTAATPNRTLISEKQPTNLLKLDTKDDLLPDHGVEVSLRGFVPNRQTAAADPSAVEWDRESSNEGVYQIRFAVVKVGGWKPGGWGSWHLARHEINGEVKSLHLETENRSQDCYGANDCSYEEILSATVSKSELQKMGRQGATTFHIYGKHKTTGTLQGEEVQALLGQAGASQQSIARK